MLVRCRDGCKQSSMTDASLDVDTNEVVCNSCGETINHITEYAKKAMKNNGDIKRKPKGSAFSFKCLTCKKDVSTFYKDEKIVGKNCEEQDCCEFNISDYMKHGIKLFSSNDDVEGEDK